MTARKINNAMKKLGIAKDTTISFDDAQKLFKQLGISGNELAKAKSSCKDNSIANLECVRAYTAINRTVAGTKNDFYLASKNYSAEFVISTDTDVKKKALKAKAYRALKLANKY